jgi:hypothetical protein
MQKAREEIAADSRELTNYVVCFSAMVEANCVDPLTGISIRPRFKRLRRMIEATPESYPAKSCRAESSLPYCFSSNLCYCPDNNPELVCVAELTMTKLLTNRQRRSRRMLCRSRRARDRDRVTDGLRAIASSSAGCLKD